MKLRCSNIVIHLYDRLLKSFQYLSIQGRKQSEEFTDESEVRNSFPLTFLFFRKKPAEKKFILPS